MSQLKEIELPEFQFDIESLVPIPADEYEARLREAVERMKTAKLDFLAIYSDREHFANLSYLTGFDPRFEEALLILDKTGSRFLLVGNECMGYLPDSRLRCETILFQEFSLLGQPRGKSDSLSSILSRIGIGPGRAVGCAGWKYFDGKLVSGGAHALDLPSYLADALRGLAGHENVQNATDIFMHPQDGLRAVNSAAQIAQFEFAACVASESILRALRKLQIGVTEREVAQQMDSSGLPLSCHPMTSFGEKVKRGLSSPSSNQAKPGDAYSIAFGVWGALNCRAGAIARGPEDLAAETRSFYPRLAANYFDVVASWYENVRIGASGGEVFNAVDKTRDATLYEFAVNPGHLIHLDEWVHSPFADGSQMKLRSGMALQMDIIPVSKGPFCYVNAEDGVALADARLRGELSAKFPVCWKRIELRRRFMIETLGIQIDDSVLPLGNMPAWLPPYALKLQTVFVNQR